MICKNCNQEISNDSAFCDKCGADVTEKSEDKTAETKVETKIEIEKADSPAPSAKPQNKKPIIIGICIAAAAVIFIGFIGFIILIGSFFGSTGGENEFIVETGNDDIYGGVSFDLTLSEFIEKYNAMIEEDAEYESVADMQKISYHDFKNDGVKDGLHNYIYSFGYTTGTYPFVTNHELASLLISVNTETEKIQAVKYVWEAEGYNTDDAMINYYYKIPAKIFSLIYSELDYPYGGDYSDYEDMLNSLYESDEPFEFTGNMVYGLFDTGTSRFWGIQFVALTEDSVLFSAQ